MPEVNVIKHDEALRLIDEHIGEKVYFAVLVGRNDQEGDDPIPVVHVMGELAYALEPEVRERGIAGDTVYTVGGPMSPWYRLAPMTGSVHVRDNGIDFQLSDDVTIRLAWRGSSEVGDWRPTAESLVVLNAHGIRLPEHEKPGVVLPSDA
jgi:hypothetical protein